MNQIEYISYRLFAVLMLAVTAASCDQPRFDPTQNAADEFNQALSASTDEAKHLMVVFGADWCGDCQKLYDNLQSTQVRNYMADHMNYLTVDVGKKDRNIEFAGQLGVSIENGIPVAVFFDPEGKPIGNTNAGQLEPSRYLTSRQILRFVQAVVEERRITRPKPPEVPAEPV